MAHRPTNPSPYFERVDATGDIDLKFRIADHDTVTSAKVIVRSNDLSGDSFPTACVLELSDGKLTATNQTESFKSDGSASAVLTKAFLSISSVTIDGTATTSYTYNAEAHSVSFTKAPSKNAVVIVTGSISVPGDWQSEVNGGNGDYSFVNMTIPAGTLENGKDYKWQIDKLNGASVDNREFFFSTKAMPTVSITAPTGDKITTVSASFSGNCDDDIEYYRYEVRDEDNAVIDKTENIYNANLSYVCSGLFAGDVITVYLYVKVKMRADELVASKTYEIDYALYGSQTTVKIDNDPYTIMLSPEFPVSEEQQALVDKLYAKFNALSAAARKACGKSRIKYEVENDAEVLRYLTVDDSGKYDVSWKTLYSDFRDRCLEICGDIRTAANAAVMSCYATHKNGNKKFMWRLVSDGIVANIEQKPVVLPVRRRSGEYEYLGKRYDMEEYTE